jgi:two-component system response regulator MprA
MIVSRDPTMRWQLYKPLRRRPFLVMTVASGPEALDLIHRAQPEIVISDAGSLHDQGLDFVAAIKTVARDSRVIMLSASRDWSLYSGTLDRGADELLPSPPADGELQRTVLRLLGDKVAP